MKQQSLLTNRTIRLALSAAVLLIFPNAYAQQAGERANYEAVLENTRSVEQSQKKITPVSIADFALTREQSEVLITWTTDREKFVSHYIIEKSTNGHVYSEIAFLFSAEKSLPSVRYAFKDQVADKAEGFVYYRLKVVYMNKTAQITASRGISFDEQPVEVEVQAFPNPVTNELRITIPASWQNKTVSAELYAANGKLIKKVTTTNASPVEIVPMINVHPGGYVLKLISGNETAVKQIIRKNESSGAF